MKNLLSLKHFINESTKDKSVNHIENIKATDKSNIKIEKDTDDYLAIHEEECPRCGEYKNDCKCKSKDPWSTQNYHRIPKGITKHNI
jgi:hypothetical protein